ncbi:hypothetical protein PENANT_c107G03825 [Penicillium antarcticum]|uniref:Uncharacterized protein n=1 Tax=Penicillium antarcticum TaxID=416450 RepID=A0A1V6PLH7_9EURO|nr:uncharacterized protein N7508_007359 [Penicillium antarcticum]KAJ5300116.1 hypothetical protein N7508_007359 [Penicillium antarcticum]OQD77386.1 hypothetical protein PENANT_c107G03825 [Penicillium antarcticum]
MGGIRKVSHTPRKQNFRSRLQRALSLSSSESEDTGSPSRSATGDTTEDDSSFQEEHDCVDQDNSTSADESEQQAVRQRKSVFGHQMGLEPRGQTQLSGDGNSVALECLTESIERSSQGQATWNETIRNDLADIFGRLALVESEIQKGTRPGSNKATEGQKIG